MGAWTARFVWQVCPIGLSAWPGEPWLVLRPEAARMVRRRDPLRLRANLNKTNIRRDESWRKPQKRKNSYTALSYLKLLFGKQFTAMRINRDLARNCPH